MKGLTFFEALSITFEKMSLDGAISETAYF